MAMTRQEEIKRAEDIAAANKRRLKAGEDFEAMMINIAASGLSAHKWLEENPTTQDQLEVMYLHGELADSIEKTSSGYAPKTITARLGEIVGALPDPGHTQDIKVNTLNDDTYEFEIKTIKIENIDGKLVQIDGEQKHGLELDEDGKTLKKETSFADNLEIALAKYKKENDFEAAIEKKDFRLIKSCIKNGVEVTDNQLIRLMRLSYGKKVGERLETPTFLHELLDPKTGISDSKHVLPLLKRAKALLSDFEFKALLELFDGTKPAYELFSGGLRSLVPASLQKSSQARQEINTHQTAIHASVDLSAARLYDRFHERHSDSVTASASTEKGVTTVSRTPEFKALVDTKVKELQAKIAAELALPDADLDKMLKDGKIDKSVKDYRFELGAAKRLVDDCVAGEKMHHYDVDFNAPSGNGITLKETLAMVYDALSDDDNLTFADAANKASDRIGHFAKLVTHLKEIRREYNGSDAEEEDKNKCPGGTMNHLVYALQGVYNDRIVDVSNPTPDDLRSDANVKANEFLLKYLADATGDDKAKLRIALAQISLGMKPDAVLDRTVLARLQSDVTAAISAQYGKYFKDELYLTNIAATAQNISITRDTAKQLGQVDYATVIPDPKDFMKAMEEGTIPLYTRTENGYELSLEVIKKANPEYCKSLLDTVLKTKNYDLFIQYQITEGKALMLEQLSPPVDDKENAQHILKFLYENYDIESLQIAKILAPDDVKEFIDKIPLESTDLQDLKLLLQLDPELEKQERFLLPFLHEMIRSDKVKAIELITRMTQEQVALQGRYGNTALHLAAEKGHTDIAKALIEKMTPEQLALQGRYGNTALHLAAEKGHTEIAKALIEKMTQEQVALQGRYGNTALHLATFHARTEIAKALIEKMTQEQVALQGRYGNTALHLATFHARTDIAKALIEKMIPEQLVLQDEYGKTALHIAAICSHTDIAKALIEKMTPEQLVLQGKDGKTALDVAILYGKTDIAKALIAKMTQEQLALKGEDGKTALDVAIAGGCTDIAKALIEKMTPEQVALQGTDGNTALHAAIIKGRTDIAKALIEKMTQEQLVSKDAGGNTALHHATFHARTDIAKALIAKMTPAQLVLQDKDGRTALHVAIKGRTDIAKALIEKMTPAQLVLQDRYGNTSLHVAIIKGRTDIAKALIAKMRPEDLQLKPSWVYKIAWSAGTYQAAPEIKLELFSKNIRIITAIHTILADESKKPHEVMTQIASSYPLVSLTPAAKLKIANYLNAKDKDGVTNFSKIVKSRDHNAIEKALEYGADPHLRSKAGLPVEIIEKTRARVAAGDPARAAQLYQIVVTLRKAMAQTSAPAAVAPLRERGAAER